VVSRIPTTKPPDLPASWHAPDRRGRTSASWSSPTATTGTRGPPASLLPGSAWATFTTPGIRSVRHLPPRLPEHGLETIIGPTFSWTGDATRLRRTYAAGAPGGRCDGDLSYRLRGRHSRLCSADLARGLEDLLELAQPSDVYTQAEFDGHPDHSELNARAGSRTKPEAAGDHTVRHTTRLPKEGSVVPAVMWLPPRLPEAERVLLDVTRCSLSLQTPSLR
jgi:hypothetical protein